MYIGRHTGVCMWKHVCICEYVGRHAYMYINIFHISMCTYMCMHVYINVYLSIQTEMSAYIFL